MKERRFSNYLRTAFILSGAVIVLSFLFIIILEPYEIGVRSQKKHITMLGNYLNSNIMHLHVDKSKEWLQKRLEFRDYIGFVSSFYSAEIAEEVIQSTLQDNQERIEAWVADQTIVKNMRKSFKKHFQNRIGYGISRNNVTNEKDLYDVKVIIQKVNNHSYKIVTAYPIDPIL
jgi:hypothetical protein